MKKIISIILSVLIISLLFIPITAIKSNATNAYISDDGVYPESSHPYLENTNSTWTYTDMLKIIKISM